MKLAVFTHQFPGRVCTFFARDMRGLIDAGIDIDVFPLYPLDPTLWRYVPDILNEKILPRNKVHHLTTGDCLRSSIPWPSEILRRFVSDATPIGASAFRFGIEAFVKSSYALLKAFVWAQRSVDHYDQIFAYWGNYTATCAYVFHRLATPSIPFSLFLHAGIDLYRNPVYMRQKLLYADNIITCSEFNRAYIKENFSDIADKTARKVFVHHHGIDLCNFSFDSNNRRPDRIVAVGRAVKDKGYDLLIRAVQQIQRSGVTVELEIVGDGDQLRPLKSLARELGIADRVRFRGWLKPDEVRCAMKEAAVLVHPSPHLGDGVPNVIKECMALGTPVIATAVAGMPELLGNGENGILVPPQDIPALAEAIRYILSDVGVQKKYASRARQAAEDHFDLWANGRRFAKLLGTSVRNLPNQKGSELAEPRVTACRSSEFTDMKS
jgi:glycosyltransferase involved in cell wall biosynthesis